MTASSSDPLEESLRNLKQQHQAKECSASPSSSEDPVSTEDLLSQIKQKYQPPKAHFPTYSLQENIAEIQATELQKQRQRKQMIAQAETWLAQLSPASEDALWFEQFAASYSSRLEAAIDYLAALEQ